MQPVRTGDKLVGRCQRLDDRGAGVVDVDLVRVHVAGALPQENVELHIDHVSPHDRGGTRDAWATLLAVPDAAPERVPPVCPAYGICGGCTLQHYDYTAQVAWKQERVRALLSRVSAGALTVDACVPSPCALEYRNQAKFVYGWTADQGQVVLGSYAPRSHAVVDMAGCRVLERPLDDIARGMRDLLAAAQVVPYDERTRTGRLRYVMLRVNGNGQVLVTLVSAKADWPDADQLARAVVAQHPAVTGVVLNVNPTAGNELYGVEERTLLGTPWLDDHIGGAPVRLSSRSFFQINRHVAGLIYGRIRAEVSALATHTRMIDAYAGAGGIAMSLLDLAGERGEIVAIEENPAATRAAQDFLAERGVRTVSYLTGDVADHLASVGHADVVVLNPPRSGCARAVLDATRALAPSLTAYVSCNPETLARDLEYLAGAHSTVTVVPYDMLPHTPHVEALALIRAR